MKKRGFTLIEMLIVIVIIGILAGALIPRIGSAREKANDVAREANVRSMATALVSYGLDHNGYPATYTPSDLSSYGISASFDTQPTSSDIYNYKQLDSGNHFIVYIKLSEGTEGGNCSVEGTPASCSDSSYTDKESCEGASKTWTEATSSNLDSYNSILTSVIKSTGDYFCYLQ